MIRRALVLASLVAAAAPATANGATVEVRVAGTSHSMVFTAAAGETNTAAVGMVGATSDPNTYFISDATAPLEAGAGCTGGGPPGSTVTCELPRSLAACFVRGCSITGPGISVGVALDLGDGDDLLDSTALPEFDGGSSGPY